MRFGLIQNALGAGKPDLAAGAARAQRPSQRSTSAERQNLYTPGCVIAWQPSSGWARMSGIAGASSSPSLQQWPP